MSSWKAQLGERIKKAIGVEGSFKETIKPMLGYNSASILFGGGGYIISLYFLAFLTEVEGLSPAQASAVILVSQIWDAVTDPAMGIITDRTRSRFGKHRVYLLLGALPIAISYFMLWYSFGISSLGKPTATMIYYMVAYMLFNTAFTIVAVPHTAMLPELAPEYFLRTQYKSVEYIMNSVGMISSFILVSFSLGYFNMELMTPALRNKFMILGFILCLWFSVPLLFTFKYTKEPSSLHMPVPELDLRALAMEFVQVFKNKAFRQYFLISVLYMMCRGFYGNSNVFFIRYIAKKPEKYNILTTIAGVAEASGFPLNYALTKKYGKQKCGKLLTPIMMAGILLNLVINEALVGLTTDVFGLFKIDWVFVVVLCVAVLYNFGYSGMGFVTTNIQPDVTDVDELITGRRREGVIATFSSFIKKTISGLMSGFTGLILKIFGFETGKGTLYQTARAQRGLRITYILLPTIFLTLSYISLFRYKMTKSQHEMIKAAIAQKKKTGKADLTEDEIRQIEEIAGQKFEDMWIGQEIDVPAIPDEAAELV